MKIRELAKMLKSKERWEVEQAYNELREKFKYLKIINFFLKFHKLFISDVTNVFGNKAICIFFDKNKEGIWRTTWLDLEYSDYYQEKLFAYDYAGMKKIDDCNW